jgi:hypothetical protein
MSQSLPHLLQATIITAVWHQDPLRHALLQGHQANLDAQTVEVERIYVFDNGDVPPNNLTGKTVIASDKLSIYEAWNLALSMVRTPYVMNLNLDDRIGADTIEHLQAEIERGADLVGGDWKICFSQTETDAVLPCYPAKAVPFAATWPPDPQHPTRLGSGTGERGTLGPACMWRMALHQEFPRYPWQFGDGTLIKSVADLVWWMLLEQNGKRLVRLPQIIGNYHSHPNEQAEFRNAPLREEERLAQVGIALI